MSDSDNDLTIDIDNGNYDQEDFYSHVPSTSSQPETKIHEQSNEVLHSDSEKEELANESDVELDAEASDSSDGSEFESSDRCAICLGRIKGKIGSPDALGCEHYFCLLCILEWAKNNPVCPQDRRPFEAVLLRNHIAGKVINKIPTVKNTSEEENPVVENPTFCEVCGSSEREDCLLLCDGCDLGYHLECLTPPLSEVPIEEWFCPLCVAAELPQVISQVSASQNKSTESHTNKKKRSKRAKSQSRTRMIPRTRASERVLQRISQTRKKQVKKKRKHNKKSSFEMDEQALERKEKKCGTVQAFKRARPFGGITDDDIDAVFNDDKYADRLLASTSSQVSKIKRQIAYDKLKNSGYSPSPSYCGRAFHPKVNECSQSNSTDIIADILEDQFVLLSTSKDVSLTGERKLLKKDGMKKIEFNFDQENCIMSKPLPSQRKAKESDEPSVEMETKGLNGNEAYPENDSESNSCNKRHYANGQTDSRHESHSSKSHSNRKRHRHSPSTKSGHSQSHSYSHSFRRRSRERYDEKAYRSRSRDSRRRRRRERSRSRDRKRSRISSRDKYEPSPRSRSRDKHRTDSKRRRYSRTPERHFKDKKWHSSKSATKSFWSSTFVEESVKGVNDSFTNISTDYENISLHTVSTPRFDHQGDPNGNHGKRSASKSSESNPESDDKIENFVDSSNVKEDAWWESCTNFSNDSKPQPDGENTAKSNQDHHAIPLKCKKDYCEAVANLPLLKSNEDDSVKLDIGKVKKQKLKQLFGDDNSESGSPVIGTETSLYHAVDQSNSSTASGKNYTSKYLDCNKHDSKRKLNSSEFASELEPKQFLSNIECSFKDTHYPLPFLAVKKVPHEGSPVKKPKESNSMKEQALAKPDEVSSFPAVSNFRSFSSEEELEDITTLSKTSRDFILSSLFGKRHFQNKEKISDQISVNEEIRIIKKDSAQTAEKGQPKKLGLINKISENENDCIGTTILGKKREKNLEKDDDKKDLTKENSMKKKAKKINSLFGDISDMELSDSECQDIVSSKSRDKTLSKLTTLELPQSTSKEEITKQNIENKERVENPKVESPKKKEEKQEIPKLVREQPKETNHAEKARLIEGLQISETKNVTPVSKSKANKLILETKVVEEAKRFLNPHYQEKGFSKQVYKEIISKCVNKVLEVECSHTIEPKKIQKLVDGYVQVYHHRNKKINPSQKNL